MRQMIGHVAKIVSHQNSLGTPPAFIMLGVAYNNVGVISSGTGDKYCQLKFYIKKHARMSSVILILCVGNSCSYPSYSICAIKHACLSQPGI